ncbi:MAG: aromatic amino acid ammonia-lyase, partial [Candidatus Symbiothrix sp.]|nr:aromatic amino acid ammonia-lyase [Candidatus Symbiothrix sp.]
MQEITEKGNTFSAKSLQNIIFDNKNVVLSEVLKTEISDCFNFLKNFSSDKIIYGINTGFGPMAQYRVDDDYLKNLQYNII